MSFITLIISLVVLLFSAILHEIAHGYVAERLGDPTAKLSGRLTLNPLKHIDPFMSIILPLLLLISHSPVIFGGAKPVPVDPFNLREGRKDLAIVSLAGPLTNFLLAIVAALSLHLINGDTNSLVGSLLQIIIQLNLLLGIFNLLPIPPLDGSKLFALLLPERDAQAYLSMSSIGFFIIFFLLAFPIGGFSLSDILFQLILYAEHLLGV